MVVYRKTDTTIDGDYAHDAKGNVIAIADTLDGDSTEHPHTIISTA
jgi:hypothetical protein